MTNLALEGVGVGSLNRYLHCETGFSQLLRITITDTNVARMFYVERRGDVDTYTHELDPNLYPVKEIFSEYAFGGMNGVGH